MRERYERVREREREREMALRRYYRLISSTTDDLKDKRQHQQQEAGFHLYFCEKEDCGLLLRADGRRFIVKCWCNSLLLVERERERSHGILRPPLAAWARTDTSTVRRKVRRSGPISLPHESDTAARQVLAKRRPRRWLIQYVVCVVVWSLY